MGDHPEGDQNQRRLFQDDRKLSTVQQENLLWPRRRRIESGYWWKSKSIIVYYKWGKELNYTMVCRACWWQRRWVERMTDLMRLKVIGVIEIIKNKSNWTNIRWNGGSEELHSLAKVGRNRLQKEVLRSEENEKLCCEQKAAVYNWFFLLYWTLLVTIPLIYKGGGHFLW